MTAFRPLIRSGTAICAFGALLVGPVEAQDAASRYVKFSLNKCPVIERHDEGSFTTWRCRDFGPYEFYVTHFDSRIFVSFGPNGSKQRAHSQTLGTFNSIHDTLEFRVRSGANAPHAAILRYFTGDGQVPGQVLVVTKIAGSEACHMAYIDALANPNANELAQKTADEGGAEFSCETDAPKIVGASGKSSM